MNSSGEAAARVLKLAARGELGFEVRVEIEDADADPPFDWSCGLIIFIHIRRLTLRSVSPARGPLNAYANTFPPYKQMLRGLKQQTEPNY